MAEAEVVQMEHVVAQHKKFELGIDIPQGNHFTTVGCIGFDQVLEMRNGMRALRLEARVCVQRCVWPLESGQRMRGGSIGFVQSQHTLCLSYFNNLFFASSFGFFKLKLF